LLTNVFIFFIFNLGTAIIVYSGFLIAYRGRRDLIAGFAESNYKAPEKYAKLFGKSMIFGTGSINFVFSILATVDQDHLHSIVSYCWLIAVPPALAWGVGYFKYRA